MSDKYYRGLRNIINDTKHKLQLASMTLKINENKNNISGIKNDISGINNFSDKINDNETNISDNLSKINDNETNISTNLTKINDNETNISTNLTKINDNETNISTNLTKINTNKSDIDEINSNLSNIDFNSDNKFSIENFFIYNIEIEKNYILNKDKTSFSIFKYVLEDKFTKDSILEIDCRLLYRYHNYNHIGLVHHIFKLYDDNDNMFYEYKSLITNSGDNKSNDLKQNDVFYAKLNDNYDIIKIELILSLINNISSSTVVDCKLYDAYRSNFINIKYYKKINLISINNNLGDIENSVLSNKNNISSNLININTNEDNIAYNLNEINYIKNNKSTQYLKNVYNILIYDSKTQISFKEEDIFYEKIFNVNANQNDFVEIFFKIQLEYRDTDDRHYVKSIYELFDENNNSLYVKTVNNNEYLYFSNKMTIDENIFYNFTNNIKKLKFIIKFQKLSVSRVVYLYYIKNDNYRLILKHYGN